MLAIKSLVSALAIKRITAASFFLKYQTSIIVGAGLLLFLPLIGRGFVLDDFVHLHSVAYDPLWQGLTRANGGPFYTPLAWLSFKFDWMFWRLNPFPLAAENLLFHAANILLLHALALHLWRSRIAARWTAIGFSLLFPANTWAVMWISTRAHLLATFFYLAALNMTLRLCRTQRRRGLGAVLIVFFAACSIFSKESGVTLPVAIAWVLFVESRNEQSTALPRFYLVTLSLSLCLVLALYAGLRINSGAVPINFSSGVWYTYTPSGKVLVENLLRYGWRTFGLLGIAAGAVGLSRSLGGAATRVSSQMKGEALYTAILFAVTIAPFILLRTRSGVYSYLPGIAAALWFGAFVHRLHDSPLKKGEDPRLILTPSVIIILLGFAVLTVGQSVKWVQMADVNTAVLKQIAKQHFSIRPDALIVLTYSKEDKIHRFPESFAWGFPYAVRLLYEIPSLNGLILRQGESYDARNRSSEIHLTYKLGADGSPHVESKMAVFWDL